MSSDPTFSWRSSPPIAVPESPPFHTVSVMHGDHTIRVIRFIRTSRGPPTPLRRRQDDHPPLTGHANQLGARPHAKVIHHAVLVEGDRPHGDAERVRGFLH